MIFSNENSQDVYSLEEVGRVSGVPFAATATPNSSDLRESHMKLTIAQKRIFRDQVVNASTGRPVFRKIA
jgi:hypothetical protein